MKKTIIFTFYNSFTGDQITRLPYIYDRMKSMNNYYLPVWFKFRDLEFRGTKYPILYTNQHASMCTNLAYAVAHEPIEKVFERVFDAIVWYNSIKDRK